MNLATLLAARAEAGEPEDRPRGQEREEERLPDDLARSSPERLTAVVYPYVRRWCEGELNTR